VRRYRLYVFDAKARHVLATHELDAADDDAAIEAARAVFQQHPHYLRAELWQAYRIVHRFQREQPGAPVSESPASR
jgi:hypothetical protein